MFTAYLNEVDKNSSCIIKGRWTLHVDYMGVEVYSEYFQTRREALEEAKKRNFTVIEPGKEDYMW